MVGNAALDNPDLPIEFVRELLIARAEGQVLATPSALIVKNPLRR
jgi:hypothetical protein